MPAVWMVTGSSRGLGRHVVEEAVRAGDHVVATARDLRSLAELAQTFGEKVFPVALDVTDAAAARAAVDAAVTRFGRLDVVVNNAGQADLGSVEDTPDTSFWHQHAVTYAGLVNVTRAALPVFRRQGSGRFLQISSLGARLGTPGLASYQAAKAAATTFSLSLAAEVAPTGILITIVEPGNLRTDMVSPRSMTVLPVSQEYESTVGEVGKRLASSDGNQPGDPRRAAQALVRISRMDTPPLRLPLGADAVTMAETAASRLADEDARWHALSTSIGYEEN
ncbi:SDR family NAD(P)-dependent oxidoreductase [Streptomyces sp. 8L]|uniref:SDR family NAD(P)-dependent oxidoreductase n=1 Tax=Streptomyces sp. 8L TaxID=2877242 RepID=UPI001CD24674|nr:SDR family NAD(P)-dependent oxidoreductase [Streptomyces sp. 8L]MCA1221014.1 SDR family NAD(P)-dependent oxidoreductase [Streptomyces sp. 8L]